MKYERNRLHNSYLIWVFIHLILFLTSGNFLTDQDSDFFPFPIYDSREVSTYHYFIYREFINSAKLGTYNQFVGNIKNDEYLHALGRMIRKFRKDLWYGYESDYINFVEDMKNSIKKYDDKKYYTVFGRVFPKGYSQYDYSEFIIYSLLPLVIFHLRNSRKKSMKI